MPRIRARKASARRRVWQAASGFDLDLPSDFRLSAYGDYSKSIGFQSRGNITDGAALTAALNSTNPATAFNPFGDGTFNLINNPGLVDIIIANRDTYATSIGKDVAAKIDGPLFDIGGGSIRVAAGLEYHEQSFKQRLEATNVLASGATTFKFIKNQRDYWSAYGELFVPLIGRGNGGPGAERLELSFAARHDDYSDFGGRPTRRSA